MPTGLAWTGAFLVTLSNFGIIFDPDPIAAVAEVARVLAPGGRVVLTAWLPGGTISQFVGACISMVATATSAPGQTPFPWHKPEALHTSFRTVGLKTTMQPREMAFHGDSPAAYLDAELANHPLAMARPRLSQPGSCEAAAASGRTGNISWRRSALGYAHGAVDA